MTMTDTAKKRSVRVRAPRHVEVSAADPMGQYLSEIGRYELLTAEQEVELAQAIEAGEKASHRLESGKVTGKERVELQRAVRRAEEARRRFISANLRLVVANARRYAGSGIEMLDLIQEGNLGLMHAVGKFDWRKGFKFSTYATFWIRQAMQRARSVHSRTIRIPVHVDEALPVVNEAREQLLTAHGRPPTIEEIAEETGISAGIVERALSVMPTVALETPIGDGNAQLGDLIADEDALGPDIEVEGILLAEEVRRAVETLPADEAEILSLRFGLDDGQPRSFADVARKVGLSEHQLPRIVARALGKLSDELAAAEDLAAA